MTATPKGALTSLQSVTQNHGQAVPFTPPRSSHRPSVPTSTRKISASFSTDGPLSGHPTTAFSTIIASTSTNHPGPLTSHPVYIPPTRSSTFSSTPSYDNMEPPLLPNRTLKASHTYSNLPMPATHKNMHPWKPSIARSNTNATGLPYRKAENIQPSSSMLSLGTNKRSTSNWPMAPPARLPQPSPKKKSKSRVGGRVDVGGGSGIPKSRTLNVLTNLTASLSRSSLGHLTNSDSRHTSTSSLSKSTSRKDPVPYLDPHSASSNLTRALLPPHVVESTNPHQIHTAQNSAYWTGRFMALQDRYQSETLMPENMATLVHAHAERSLLPAKKTSIPGSATTNCLTPSAAPNPRQDAHFSTRQSSMASTGSHKTQKHVHPSKWQPRSTPHTTRRSTTAVATAQPSYEQHEAALLVDEDSRSRRIFLHLDALCTTSEARTSLRQWQQSYARRTSNAKLLPEGGTMHGRSRELTWVGRLLIGSGSGHSKRGSFVL